MCVPRVIMCYMTHSGVIQFINVWHNSEAVLHIFGFLAPLAVYICDMTHWYTSDMSHSCVTHSLLFRVVKQTDNTRWTYLIHHTCGMTHSCVTLLVVCPTYLCLSCRCPLFVNVWHDSSMYVTWTVHMCDTTHPFTCDMTHSCTCGKLDSCV